MSRQHEPTPPFKGRRTGFHQLYKAHKNNKWLMIRMRHTSRQGLLAAELNLLVNLANLDDAAFDSVFTLVKILGSALYALDKRTVADKHLLSHMHHQDKYRVFTHNYEKELMERFSFSKSEKRRYFNQHESYRLMGNFFAMPFATLGTEIQQVYYEHGYALAMFLYLDMFFNKHAVADNAGFYSCKLLSHRQQITALSTITPRFYNLLVMTVNRWVGKKRHHPRTKGER